MTEFLLHKGKGICIVWLYIGGRIKVGGCVLLDWESWEGEDVSCCFVGEIVDLEVRVKLCYHIHHHSQHTIHKRTLYLQSLVLVVEVLWSKKVPKKLVVLSPGTSHFCPPEVLDRKDFYWDSTNFLLVSQICPSWSPKVATSPRIFMIIGQFWGFFEKSLLLLQLSCSALYLIVEVTFLNAYYRECPTAKWLLLPSQLPRNNLHISKTTRVSIIMMIIIM